MQLLWSHLRRMRGVLLGTLVLATINQVFSLLDPQIFRMIIDRYAMHATEMERGAFLAGVLWLLGASVGVAFVSRVAKNFQDYFVSSITQKVGAGLYEQAVAHSFSLPYSVFEDQRSGELLGKLQKARSDVERFLQSAVTSLYLPVIGVLFVLVYATWVHWSVGLLYFLMIPGLGSVTMLVTRRIKRIQKDIVAKTAALAGSTTETIRNVELVKSLGLEEQEVRRLNEVNTEILALELAKVRMVRKLNFLQGTVINALRASILLLMLVLINAGAITLGEFFSLFIYSFFIFAPLGELGNVASQYQEVRASMEQLETLLAQKPDPIPAHPANLGSLATVQFEDVRFRYPASEHAVLHDISLALNGGETIAFVGPSGSGKSTLVKLLVGLYPTTEGTITVNATPIAKLDPAQLRGRIGLVTQDTQLFMGTIRENLRFVRPEATDDEMLDVLRQAAALPIIERGGKGLDTKIGEGGIKISGGERQRIAIARALLRQPELLIFDEATSALDSITEKAISSTIQEITHARPNLMSVLVAHRLSTVAHATRIYVLERGKIVEHGTHQQLLAEKGLYYALWRQQQAEEAA